MFNTLNNLEASISAIRAFNDLLAAAAYQGDSLAEISGGMHVLLGTQIDALEASHTAIRGEFSHLKDQTNELSAKLALNSKETKSQVDPRDLRADFIHDKVGEGYDAGEIANALNLKKETVEKVIRKLMGNSADEAQVQTETNLRTGSQ